MLGEYGAINKGNKIDRAYHMEIVNRLCQINGVVPVYWDQGWYDLNADPDYSFTLIDRDTCEEIFPDIIDAILRGTYFSGAEDLTDIIIEPKISPIMNMDHYIETIYTQVGNVTEVSLIGIVDKKNSKDTIVWKSNNESVATVNATNLDLDNWTANIHATGIGVTTIIASSRSGGAQIEIPIIVTAATTEVSCEEIVVTQESYELLEDQFIYLNTSILPTNTDSHLTYYSTNTDTITVSIIGKLVAKNKGQAIIILFS